MSFCKKIKPYIISVVIALSVGGLSAIITVPNMKMFDDINMPTLSPPPILFPIVWTILYILMGISIANVYVNRIRNLKAERSSLKIYSLNLIFNFCWSIFFFNFRIFWFSFVWLVILWVLVLLMIIYFSKVSKWAGLIQIPYLIWVTFAGYLNLSIAMLN